MVSSLDENTFKRFVNFNEQGINTSRKPFILFLAVYPQCELFPVRWINKVIVRATKRQIVSNTFSVSTFIFLYFFTEHA